MFVLTVFLSPSAPSQNRGTSLAFVPSGYSTAHIHIGINDDVHVMVMTLTMLIEAAGTKWTCALSHVEMLTVSFPTNQIAACQYKSELVCGDLQMMLS